MSPANFAPGTGPTPDADARTRPRRPTSIPTRRSTPTSPPCSTSAADARASSGPPPGPPAPTPSPTLGGLTVDDQTSLTLCRRPPPSRARAGRPSRRTRTPATRTSSCTTPPSRARCSEASRDGRERPARCAPSPRPPRTSRSHRPRPAARPLLVALDRDVARVAVGPAQRDHDRDAGSRRHPAHPRRLASSDDARRRRSRMPRPTRHAWPRHPLSLADESELSRFATILDDPSLLTGPERAEILQLLGIAWLPEPEPWSAAIAAHRAADGDDARLRRPAADRARSTCSAPAPTSASGCATTFRTRSTSSCTRRPTTCGSTCSAATPVVAGAASNTRVEVPVQARIGNGEVTLALQLRSRASVAIGERHDRRGQRPRRMGERRHHRAVGRRRRAAGPRRRAHGAARARATQARRSRPPPARAPTAAETTRPTLPTRPTTGCPRPASERHRARERAHRRRHDRLAPHRASCARSCWSRPSAPTTEAGNAFAIANQLPNNIYAIISTGLLSAVVVPQIVKAGRARRRRPGVRLEALHARHRRAARHRRRSRRSPRRGSSQLYAPGFTPDQQALATAFAYWCLPQIFFYGLYALVGESLNARRVFGPFTWAPIVNNVVSITGFLALHRGSSAPGGTPVATGRPR